MRARARGQRQQSRKRAGDYASRCGIALRQTKRHASTSSEALTPWVVAIRTDEIAECAMNLAASCALEPASMPPPLHRRQKMMRGPHSAYGHGCETRAQTVQSE